MKIALLFLPALVAACGTNGPGRFPWTAGTRPPAKSVELILAENPGKAAIVVFWASWCPPCIEQLEIARRMVESRPEKIAAVGLNMEQKAWTNSVLPSFSVSDDDVQTYLVRVLPTTLIFDTTGRLRHRRENLQPSDRLEGILRALLPL